MDSKVELLKRRFKRMGLVRQFFSVQKQGQDRKFDFPVNEDAEENKERGRGGLYDEIQYCIESDIEDKKEKKHYREIKHKEIEELRSIQ